MALDLWIVFIFEIFHGCVCCMPAVLLFEKKLIFKVWTDNNNKKTCKIIQYAKGRESNSMPLQSMFEKLWCTCPNPLDKRDKGLKGVSSN